WHFHYTTHGIEVSFFYAKSRTCSFIVTYFSAVLIFYNCVKGKGFGLWYCGVWGTMTFLLVLETSYVLCSPLLGDLGNWLLKILFSVAVNVAIGLTLARWMPEKGQYQIGPRQMVSAWVFCIMSENLFIYAKVDPGAALFNIVLQFYCITLLYLQSALFKKSSMRKELETIQLLWHQQKGQYQLSKETIELINHKCHDLKHQVQAIRAVKDEKERETYLEKIEKSVQIYSAIVRTGNEILDTILTEKSLICENSGIHINCVADGSLLAFMNPVDLYTLFGNALDNAIEAVRKLESKEKRVIDIMLYERQSFLMLQIVNPMCGEVKFEDGLPLTTKAKNGYHGYGMKSMLHTIQKYEGHLTTEVKNGCFYFNVMLPLERDSNKK
ncbi:ATP-binding protein, partial [Mediterraneibacter gnavus]|uniref:ATP-binding protein n=2 Tax=Mediterraneibacter gnavus TaxID=33038 RepID=UPI001FADCD25